ncbi:MAG: hypothetical protein WDA14_11225 [Sphaerochaetaceae bacterium]|jgi:hypothetical protein
MNFYQLIREIGLDQNQIDSLNPFFHHAALDMKDFSISNKLKHDDLMRKVREYAKTLFEDREVFISSMNSLIVELIEKDLLLVEKNQSKDKMRCQVDKIYDSTEMKVKLLKFLQGSGQGKQRTEIATHFNISENALADRIQELRSPHNQILGTRIKIELERKTNLYDSTVHPLFLALNLSEVYGMIIGLMKAEQFVPGDTVTNIIKDLVCQLTDYAKDILKESGLDIDAYTTDGPRSFRNESPKNRYYHVMKAGSLCRLLLYEGGDPLLGKLKPNLDHGKEFIFHPQDGDTPLQLDCSDIKDLIEIEEG